MSFFIFMKRIDLVGKKFGRLTVIEPIGFIKHHFRWRCICDCGKEVNVSSQGLREGRSLSCGCYRLERIKEVNSTQKGNSRNENKETYHTWVSMIGRCVKKNHKAYKYYGGRGIKVCDRWLGKDGFSNFLEDVGKRPSHLFSLDRFPDNNGNYEKNNCRWATRVQQQHNLRSNKWYEHEGKIMIAEDWCKELGISTGCLRKRMKKTTKTFTEIYHELKPSNNLKNEVVLNIFKEKGSNREIAEKYNTSQRIVCDIKRGWTWRNVTGKEYIPR